LTLLGRIAGITQMRAIAADGRGVAVFVSLDACVLVMTAIHARKNG